jgi:hypothetical protein
MPDGSVRYSRTGSQTPVWVTAQALTALARRPFPIAPVAHGAQARPAAVNIPVRPAAPAHPAASGRARVRPAAAATAAAVIVALAGGSVEPLMRGLSGAL